MKFNVYSENNIPITKNILASPEFKKLWEEREITALFSYYGNSIKIKKADTK